MKTTLSKLRLLFLVLIISTFDFSSVAQPCTNIVNGWRNASSASDISYCNGRVGIDNSNPLEDLQIGNRLTLRGDPSNSVIGHNWYYQNSPDRRITDGKASTIIFGNDGDIVFSVAKHGTANSIIPWSDWRRIKINNDGKLLIGDCNPPAGEVYNLYVRGGIRTEELKIDIAGQAGWADYVFHPDYKLKSIDELSNFIKANRHLPNIPSEEEVCNNGINVADISSRLLAKVEELTLYVIQLNEQNKELNEKYEQLLQSK